MEQIPTRGRPNPNHHKRYQKRGRQQSHFDKRNSNPDRKREGKRESWKWRRKWDDPNHIRARQEQELRNQSTMGFSSELCQSDKATVAKEEKETKI